MYAVEYLKFWVKPELRDLFVERDREIWTAFLATVPGFDHKEVWLSSDDPSELVTMVLWTDREKWKSIPQADLDATEIRFSAAMGEGNYQMTDAREYRLVDRQPLQPPA